VDEVLHPGGVGVALGRDAFEARVVALDGDHGVIDAFADGGLLGAGLKVGPAASAGTQKTFSALYSSGASALAPA
jgi:hypothetical protein